MTSKKLVLILSSIFIILMGMTSCEKKNDPPKKLEVQKNIYDENADARTDIARAIAEAQQTNRHILLMFGGNWCIWCHRLHHLFMEDPTINQFLNQNYIRVMIDVGKRDKNLDLNDKYGNPYAQGFPVLVILDKDGNQLQTQETGSLEYTAAESKEKGHHPARVLQFLKTWAPASSKL